MSGVYTNTDINKVRSIFFNGMNSMTDMGLLMIGSTPLSSVSPKLVEEEVAYTNGDLDLSRSDGNLYYQTRTISYTFIFISPNEDSETPVEKNIKITDKMREINEWLYDFNNTVTSWTAVYDGHSYSMGTRDMLDTGYSLKFQNARVESIEPGKGMFNEQWVDQITVNFKVDPIMVNRGSQVVDVNTFGDRALSLRRFTGNEVWSTSNTNVKPQTIMTLYLKNMGISGALNTYWMNDFSEMRYQDEGAVTDTTGHSWNYIIEVPYSGRIGMYIDPIAYDPNTNRTYEIDTVKWGTSSDRSVTPTMPNGTLYFLDNESDTYSTSAKGGNLVTTPVGWAGKRVVNLFVTYVDAYVAPGGETERSSWVPRIYYEWGPLLDMPNDVTAGDTVNIESKGYIRGTQNDTCATINGSFAWNQQTKKGIMVLLDQPVNIINARSTNFNKLWTIKKGDVDTTRGL
jgi:hypothetical protein